MTTFRASVRFALAASCFALTASAAFAQPVQTTPPGTTTTPKTTNPPVSNNPPAKGLEEENGVLLETVGLLAGLQLYQTYLNIGLLADSAAEEVYEPEEALQLLGSVVGPLEKIEKQLDKVAALKLTKDDAAAVARMKKIAGLLRQQGTSLQAYWDKGEEEQNKKYEAARQAAWKELNDLLDLEPKKKSNGPGIIVIEPKKP